MSQPIRGQGGHLVFPIRSKNTNLVGGVEILLSVKFRWIPFSRFRGEVENVKVNAGRTQDGRTDDGRCAMTIAHLSLRLRWAKKLIFSLSLSHVTTWHVSLSQMLNDTLWSGHIQWQPPTCQTLYRTRPLTEIWVVSIEHLRRVWHADRGRLLLQTPGPVPLELAYVLRVEVK